MTALPSSFLTQPIAHRGLHDRTQGRPENSRASILAAIEHGYGIEIDVQRSMDGTAMVFHDYTLNRLTDHAGAVSSHIAKQLRAITLTGTDEAIPDLQEVLDLVSGRAPLLVEIKDQDGRMGQNVGPLETAVAYALERYDGPVAVMSFNPHSVALMAKLAANVPRGLVTSAYRAEDWDLPDHVCDKLRDIPDFDRTGACFISHEAADLSRPRVTELKTAGAAILCWTIRSAEQEQQARKIADNVTFEGYLPDLPS